MVLLSNLSEKTRVRYVAVRLTGTTSNRNGLGAVVKVTAGASTYTKVMDGNSGYLSHSLSPLYFGLGASDAVDRIEVAWPSGKKQVVQAPNQRSIRWSTFESRRSARQRPGSGAGFRGAVADVGVLRRLRNVLSVEARVRRIECIGLAVDRAAQIGHISVNE